MFTLIQPHETYKYQALMAQGYKLRKKVFADQLGWDVPVHGDYEIDAYDAMGASYLIWCSDDRKRLYGLVRLMATTGPTLLHDVFGETHGHSAELIAEDIWEGTRMCIDEDAIGGAFGMTAAEGFNHLFLGLCEAALAMNVRRLVSNFEGCMSRVYRRAGLVYDLHGKADGYGKRPVYCASFAVTARVLGVMRQAIGVKLPLFTRSPDFICPLPDDVAVAA